MKFPTIGKQDLRNGFRLNDAKILRWGVAKSAAKTARGQSGVMNGVHRRRRCHPGMGKTPHSVLGEMPLSLRCDECYS